jgi:hypothetical protein
MRLAPTLQWGAMKNVLITGVSTGIGRAAAEHLVAQGYRVFGSVRREEDKQKLQEQLGNTFTPLLFDVTDEADVRAGVLQMKRELHGAGLDALVNNAGVAVSGPLMFASDENLRRHFDVNVFGMMNVTRAVLPLLGARENHTGPLGRILNLSSQPHWMRLPFIGAYSASKSAVEALSDMLRRELRLWGIDVIVLKPRRVRTELWNKTKGADIRPYLGTPFAPYLEQFRDYLVEYSKQGGIAPKEVAKLIHHAIETPSPRTRYTSVPGYFTRRVLPRLIPDRWKLDALLGKQTDLQRRRRRP